MSEFYTFKAKSLTDKEISMETYRGKVVLVVNTASKCGLTPQYKGLQELYDQYNERDFVVLGFPCNQFAGQEPGDADSIGQTCHINYGVTFPMFAKVKVNGSSAHPLFKYLKKSLSGLLTSQIKWNFTKFLIDAQGNTVKRFGPAKTPKSMKKEIEALLNKQDKSSAQAMGA